jgi:hypothetical protein
MKRLRTADEDTVRWLADVTPVARVEEGAHTRGNGRSARRAALGLALWVLTVGCAASTPPVASPDKLAARLAVRPRVILTVSVDWEGGSLRDTNLAALEALRRDLPGVPFTHLMNAAYYTRAGADPAEVTAGIKRGFQAGDELGLHIHAYRSLIEAAGVAFRDGPTFFGRPLRSRDGDSGHEVELAAYTVGELRSIVRLARGRLVEAGFAITRSFRAAGWIADAKVLEAIRTEGFEVDTSATDSKWFTEELADRPILGRIRELWPNVKETTQPFAINTPAGTILEMPDTGALADYVSAEDMSGHVQEALARVRSGSSRPVFVHVGLHQESAARFAGRVSAALTGFRQEKDIEYLTLEKAAAVARTLGTLAPDAPVVATGP